MKNEFIAGGISGAIYDPLSDEAIAHAILYYEKIRNTESDYDCKKISNNTGFTTSQVKLVKTYLFLDPQYLEDGYRRFDPSFEIAQSWERLSSIYSKDILEHDFLLIPHELEEIKIIATEGLTQLKAHNKANLIYDYSLAAKKYYSEQKRLHPNKKLHYGGELLNDPTKQHYPKR